MIDLQPGIRYVVTKRSRDWTFRVGDHIFLNKDGSISCVEAQGWIEAADVAQATRGMKVVIDYAWLEYRRQKLLKQLDQLESIQCAANPTGSDCKGC